MPNKIYPITSIAYRGTHPDPIHDGCRCKWRDRGISLRSEANHVPADVGIREDHPMFFARHEPPLGTRDTCGQCLRALHRDDRIGIAVDHEGSCDDARCIRPEIDIHTGGDVSQLRRIPAYALRSGHRGGFLSKSLLLLVPGVEGAEPTRFFAFPQGIERDFRIGGPLVECGLHSFPLQGGTLRAHERRLRIGVRPEVESGADECERANASGVRGGEDDRDRPARRHADDMGAFDGEMVEERLQVARLALQVVAVVRRGGAKTAAPLVPDEAKMVDKILSPPPTEGSAPVTERMQQAGITAVDVHERRGIAALLVVHGEPVRVDGGHRPDLLAARMRVNARETIPEKRWGGRKRPNPSSTRPESDPIR